MRIGAEGSAHVGHLGCVLIGVQPLVSRSGVITAAPSCSKQDSPHMPVAAEEASPGELRLINSRWR